jgi:hypothetical protein
VIPSHGNIKVGEAAGKRIMDDPPLTPPYQMWKGLSSLNKVHLHEAELFLYIKAKGGVKEGRRGRREEL